jgi:glycyl-tRNA synthetase beta chain
LYARAQGASAAVGDAIYDQYRPVSMEDSVPRTVEGALLAIADKADTIAGMFGLGLEPTGSKDPFALRRAANGIVKILAETAVALPLTLAEVASAAGSEESVGLRIRGFLAERLEFYLREARGQAYDVVKAVLAAGAEDVRDAVARAEAVTAVRGASSEGNGDFAAVSAAFKRMKNILAQAGFELQSSGWPEGLVDGSSSQGALQAKAVLVGLRVQELRQRHEYREALEEIASLRPEVDAFFEQVMVMDPDPSIREQRLRLLAMIVRSFSGIADFSEIVVAG